MDRLGYPKALRTPNVFWAWPAPSTSIEAFNIYYRQHLFIVSHHILINKYILQKNVVA